MQFIILYYRHDKLCADMQQELAVVNTVSMYLLCITSPCLLAGQHHLTDWFVYHVLVWPWSGILGMGHGWYGTWGRRLT